jgi:hypothetical protein
MEPRLSSPLPRPLPRPAPLPGELALLPGFFGTLGSSYFPIANCFVSARVLFDLGVNADEATDEAADATFST